MALYKEDAYKKLLEVEYHPGDLVWVVLKNERKLVGTYNKLCPPKIRPLEVLERINANAYRVCIPPIIRIADVFNATHFPIPWWQWCLRFEGEFFSTPGDLMQSILSKLSQNILGLVLVFFECPTCCG